MAPDQPKQPEMPHAAAFTDVLPSDQRIAALGWGWQGSGRGKNNYTSFEIIRQMNEIVFAF
jgi:hypothetical protein